MVVGDGTSVREFIDFINNMGFGTIGMFDDVCEQIERLVKQSNGGFGAYLQLVYDWVNLVVKFCSFDLFVWYVVFEF